MSKLRKMLTNFPQFVRDAPLYRRYVAEHAPPPARSRTSTPAAATPKRDHPLPTLNLAKETKMSPLEQRLSKANRRFLRFDAPPAVIDRIVHRLAASVRDFMLASGFADRDYEGDVRDFLSVCETNPALGAARTTAGGSLIWLFVIARALSPRVVVESGVFKGASLYTLHNACPESSVHAFDIDLSSLLYAHSAIHYHEGDWSEAYPTASGPTDLCYFDDHINNCLRVREAYDHGFRHLIIDDSPEIGELHKWRFPGVPTLQMVHEETLAPGEWVEWTWKDRRLRYTYSEADTHGVKDLLDLVVELPSLSSLTGRPTGVQTYVRLKDPVSAET